MENFLWRVNRKINKIVISYSKNTRPSSAPYISGDSFRALADHIHEKGNLLDASLIKVRDIVFVESQILLSFFTDVHPLIQQPYILITHNGDTNIDVSFTKFIDEKIIHWFAQNVQVEHTKITPIPIGLENAYYHNNGIPRIFKSLQTKMSPKNARILCAFSIQTNRPIRQMVLDSLADLKTIDFFPKKIALSNSPKTRTKCLSEYMFIISPPGNGEDCIRTWEAMLVRTIPIVKNSVGLKYFKTLGLPLMIVESYDEICKLTEYDLSAKYDLIMSTANKEALYLNYWKEKIITYKKQ